MAQAGRVVVASAPGPVPWGCVPGQMEPAELTAAGRAGYTGNTGNTGHAGERAVFAQ